MKYKELVKYNNEYVEIDAGDHQVMGLFCTDTKNKNYVFVFVPVYDNDDGVGDYAEVELNIRKIYNIREV